MNNQDDEMSDEVRRKFKNQKRAYKELTTLKRELEKLRKKMQENGKNPLPSPPNSPAEDID